MTQSTPEVYTRAQKSPVVDKDVDVGRGGLTRVEDEGRRAKYLTRGAPVSDMSLERPAYALTAGELGLIVARAVGEAMGRSQELLVDKQVLAQRLGCSASHIDHLRKRGLPTVRIGQAVRFEPERVLEWLRTQSSPDNDTDHDSEG